MGGLPLVVPEEREVLELSPYDRQLLSDIKVAASAGVVAADKHKADVLARFERRTLSEDAIAAIEDSTADFRLTAEYILTITQPGREQSAALTALEEAKFWTNQSIALNGAASE